MWEKLKSIIADDTIYTAILIVLVGIGSFGLGRISVVKTSSNSTVQAQILPKPSVNGAKLADFATSTKTAEVSLKPKVADNIVKPVNLVGQDVKPYVASKSGTKYHLLTCSGAKRIKEENKVFFASKEEAEASGYSKATNCPGL